MSLDSPGSVIVTILIIVACIVPEIVFLIIVCRKSRDDKMKKTRLPD